MRALTILWRIWHDKRGNAAMEFAFVAPVYCLLLLGLMDASHTLYTQSVLEGVMQKAARDSALESGGLSAQQTAIDARITDQVHKLQNGATVTISRRFFRDFTKAASKTAEPFTDTNGNNTCDGNEPYQDNNNNSVWDRDGGNSGQGGAKDTVILTADVTYPRILPLYKFMGLSNTTHLAASTVLANQPFGDQANDATPVARNCTP